MGGERKPNRTAKGPTLEMVICAVILGGSLLYYFRVGLLYSAHFNHGGSIYGTIKGQGLSEGWMFKDRLMDLRDDCWRRFRWVLYSGAPLWFAAMIFMSKQVRLKWPEYDAQARVLFYLTYASIKLLLYLAEWGVGKGMFLKFPLWHMMMKNISYGMDKHWAKIDRPPMQYHGENDTPEGAYKERIDRHHREEDYDIWCYFVYQFYSPFYMDGPLITYNDFTSQYKGYSVFWYGIKVISGFFLIELVSHFLYAEAISKTGVYRLLMADVSEFSDFDDLPLFGPLGCVALICCCIFLYWFKVGILKASDHMLLKGWRMIEWRFFRLVGCLDGIEAPEDFPKCVACNLDMQSFWKNWHASYNKWCVRYIYIPMGGSRGSFLTKVFSISTVFAFMAVFHNINLDFAKWGAMLVLFLCGEVAVKWLIKQGMGGFQFGSNVLFQERLACVGSTIQLLAFIFVNAGAFTFGMDRIGEAILSFLKRPLLCVLIFLACYSNQRLAMMAKKSPRLANNNSTRKDQNQ
ncbi:hypothetical protein BSKO_06628 [Bryopsis sp. KO-2023]|nr:hypothetical protein BSKO_06628 [Bryopsis sp. KO-2023]